MLPQSMTATSTACIIYEEASDNELQSNFSPGVKWSQGNESIDLCINACLVLQVNKDVLVRNSDRFFLEEVGAITKVENLRKREVQVNTRIYYAQKR